MSSYAHPQSRSVDPVRRVVVWCLLLAAAFGAAVYAGRPELFVGGVAVGAFCAATAARPRLGLYAAMALAPLEAAGRVVASIPAFTWSKVALALALAAVVAGALIADHRIELPQRFWAFAAMPVLGVASTFAGPYAPDSDTITGIAVMGSNVLFVLLAYHLIRSRLQLLLAVLAVIAGSVPVVAFGLVEIVTRQAFFENPMLSEPLWAPGTADMFRITSTFYDPNVLGRYLVFMALWTLAALWIPALKRIRVPLAVLLGLQVLCIVYTFSRAAFLTGALVAAPFMLYALFKKLRGVGLAVAAVLGAAGVTAVWPVLAVVLRRFDDPTAGGRLEIVSAAFPVMGARPFFGYGREHVATALGTVLGEATDPHNILTETVLSWGVIGLLIIAAWAVPVVRGLFGLWRAGDPYARVLALPLIGVLIFGMSLHGIDGYELWFPIALALPLMRIAGSEQAVVAP